MKGLSALVVFVLVACSVAAQPALKPEDIPKDFTDQKPFDLEAGPEAAVLKGKGVFFNTATEAAATATATPPAVPPSRATVPWTPFISYDVNAQYHYTDEAKRVADVSLRPSLVKGWFTVGDPFIPSTFVARRSVETYLDVRSRSTNQAESDASTEPDDKDRSFFYGGVGVQYRHEFRKLLEWQSLTGADLEQPTVGITYYKKISGKVPDDASEGFDAIQALLSFDVPIPLTAGLRPASEFQKQLKEFIDASAVAAQTGAPLPEPPKRPSFPFTLGIQLKASRPTEGVTRETEKFADVALKMMQANSKIGYVLRYRTGKELGFEYDTKLIAGIVLRLFE